MVVSKLLSEGAVIIVVTNLVKALMDIYIHVSSNARVICHASSNIFAGPCSHRDDQSSRTRPEKKGLSDRFRLSETLMLSTTGHQQRG